MPTPSDPLEAGVAIGQALDAAGVPYALGGALAHGLWAVPRATVDVDLNVFVEDDALDHVMETLRSVGVDFDFVTARQEIEARGMFVGRMGGFRIDVFTPSIAFAWEAMKSRVSRTLDGRPVWFLSAEALAVFKLLFFRPKDVVDLQRLLAVQGDRLDTSYVREKLVEMMGADDVRVAKWDELVAAPAPR